MSLFDVIKYPLSDPPTRQEIESLPEEVIFSYNIDTNEQTIRQGMYLDFKELFNNIEINKYSKSEYAYRIYALKRSILEL